uniref:Uncharacterized protein n=1 Tax=Zonotrichia albicollis TaxID=44394 RepID=A0A8D2NC23_ZONAL
MWGQPGCKRWRGHWGVPWDLHSAPAQVGLGTQDLEENSGSTERTQLEEETEHNKIFPAVTICNLNPARFSQLSSHDLYWAGEMLGLLDSAGRPLVPESPERSRLEALLGTQAVSEEEKSRPFHLEEFYERAGHQLELGEMLVRCTFAKGDCNSSDFQTVSGTFWGPLGWHHSLVHCCGADKEIPAPSDQGSGKGRMSGTSFGGL